MPRAAQEARLFRVRARYPGTAAAAGAVAAQLRADARITSPAVRASGASGTLDLTGNVRASDAASGVSVATRAFATALRRARASTSPAPTELVVEAAAKAGERSEVVSAAEVARLLGVSRERVRQLAEQSGRFPAAIGNIRGSRAWRWGDVSDWLSAGGRRPPGRPRGRPNATDR
jgi:predicted DNA-binding transcriptional regulator AlpA